MYYFSDFSYKLKKRLKLISFFQILNENETTGLVDIDGYEAEQESPGAYLNELLQDVTESDILDSKNPIFSPCYQSSKLTVLKNVLEERFVDTESKDKIVIVSEWVTYLDVIEEHLSELGMTCGNYQFFFTNNL